MEREEIQATLDLLSHGKEIRFYAEGNGKLLKYFKQGSSVVSCALQKVVDG
jgi:hypothetical protein